MSYLQIMPQDVRVSTDKTILEDRISTYHNVDVIGMVKRSKEDVKDETR